MQYQHNELIPAQLIYRLLSVRYICHTFPKKTNKTSRNPTGEVEGYKRQLRQKPTWPDWCYHAAPVCLYWSDKVTDWSRFDVTRCRILPLHGCSTPTKASFQIRNPHHISVVSPVMWGFHGGGSGAICSCSIAHDGSCTFLLSFFKVKQFLIKR